MVPVFTSSVAGRGWGWVIAVDLEEAIPEGKTRSLPGLELNTAMERAYIISYSGLLLLETGSYLMVKKNILHPARRSILSLHCSANELSQC